MQAGQSQIDQAEQNMFPSVLWQTGWFWYGGEGKEGAAQSKGWGGKRERSVGEAVVSVGSVYKQGEAERGSIVKDYLYNTALLQQQTTEDIWEHASGLDDIIQLFMENKTALPHTGLLELYTEDVRRGKTWSSSINSSSSALKSEKLILLALHRQLSQAFIKGDHKD